MQASCDIYHFGNTFHLCHVVLCCAVEVCTVENVRNPQCGILLMLISALFTQVREHPVFDHSENQFVGSVTGRKRSSLRTLSPFHYTSWRIGQQQSPSTSDFGQLILTLRVVVLTQQIYFSRESNGPPNLESETPRCLIFL